MARKCWKNQFYDKKCCKNHRYFDKNLGVVPWSTYSFQVRSEIFLWIPKTQIVYHKKISKKYCKIKKSFYCIFQIWAVFGPPCIGYGSDPKKNYTKIFLTKNGIGNVKNKYLKVSRKCWKNPFYEKKYCKNHRYFDKNLGVVPGS